MPRTKRQKLLDALEVAARGIELFLRELDEVEKSFEANKGHLDEIEDGGTE